jgi:hypothetical protein
VWNSPTPHGRRALPRRARRPLLHIYNGERLLGHVAEREGRARAVTWPDEIDIGTFKSRKDAADAVALAARKAAKA